MTAESGRALTNNEDLFIIQNLVKTYDVGEVKVHALRGVNCEIKQGESIVLLGPSGSGKSTLLNIIGGLDIPTSGNVLFKGHNLNQYNELQLTYYRRESIGFVFQFYNLIPSLTAIENVALVTDLTSHPMKPAEALEIVGLTHRLKHFPAQLSGGEQQRVAIARAIAKNPEILLCDEPTGALDLETGIKVLEAIEHVNEQLGTTTVLITHNANMSKMADRVLYLADGEISKEVKHEEKLRAKDLDW